MRRRPRDLNEKAIADQKKWSHREGDIGIVLSGGGTRAAYQIGALKALAPYLSRSEQKVKVIIGSSVGAINGLLLAACMKGGIESAVEEIENIWKERNFRNTFSDSPSMAFFKTIKLAFMQYLAPGPNPNSASVFNPSPLMKIVDDTIHAHGGLNPESRDPDLESVAVMTTVEGKQRRPLLFVSSHKEIDEIAMRGASFEVCYVDDLDTRHGFASAALPSILPPVEIDTAHGSVQLVDGGISQNVPVDPAVRMGADRVIVIDISGRDWWLDRFNCELDTRPEWEVPAEAKTFCMRPPDMFVVRCRRPLGDLLKNVVSGSTARFISAVGPIWPVFALLKNRLGEEAAYETLSYVALDPDYVLGLIERGYNETIHLLHNREEPSFDHAKSYEQMVEKVMGE